MKKLFKFLFKTLIWLFVILIVAVVVAYLTVSIWIKPVVSAVVPKITQTNASLESADISLFSGRFALKGLKIANPAGFSEPYIFELGEISVQFQPKTIFTDKIVVDKVLIKETQIAAEYNQKGQMNLLVLNDNVQNSLNQENSKGTTNAQNRPVKTEAKSKKAVVIKDLQILDTSFRFGIMGRSSKLILPNIQEKNIGESKKMTLAGAIQFISEKLTLEPIQEMVKSSQQAIKNAFKVIEQHTSDHSAIDSLKDIFSEANIF